MNRHTLALLREQYDKMKQEQDENKFVQSIEQQFNISGGNQVIVQRGAQPTINIYTDKKPAMLNEEEQELVDVLSPLFHDNVEETKKFIQYIKGKKATEVTATVNTFLRQGKISSSMCYKPLYDILHHYGFYTKSQSNWNDQIKG